MTKQKVQNRLKKKLDIFLLKKKPFSTSNSNAFLAPTMLILKFKKKKNW
jgi:hypothetical protein